MFGGSNQPISVVFFCSISEMPQGGLPLRPYNVHSHAHPPAATSGVRMLHYVALLQKILYTKMLQQSEFQFSLIGKVYVHH
eukprot:COSAG04_NODE_2504_length_3997_cov_69.575423_3_plen_81_part_00